MPRVEDSRLLRGAGRFVDDIELPGLLHAAFLRSPTAHARLKHVETAKARALPGVRGVFIYADLRPSLTCDRIPLAQPSAAIRFDVNPPCLAIDELCYVGEPIALVVATSRGEAEDAANAIELDFEPLPAVTDPRAGLAPGAPKARLECPDNLVAHQRVAYGDVASAFAKAALRVEAHFRLHKGGGHSIEPRGMVARFDPVEELLTMWDSTQMPHRAKAILVSVLGLPENQIRVLAPDVGGGFGTKAVFHPEELAIPAAALQLGAPVKWIEDRLESFTASAQERDQDWQVEAAADADGRLLAIRGKLCHDHGAATPYGVALPYNAATNLIGPYGRVVRELAREDGMPGQDVALGVDMELQDLAYKRCAAQGSAACVALDAWTGEVLVMASAPGFDPGAFAAGLTPAMWHQLVTDPYHPLDDKAIAGAYAPGSTFKPTVAMAGLESGLITPETEFFCPGYFRLGNSIFHCWKHGGHGTISLHRAIVESCDVYFYNVADRVGIDRIAAMAHRFGLGTKLGIDIPGEKTGLIPTRAWKQATYGVPWQKGETISCGIGQSFVSVTPLQLATYVARLVTARAVLPRVARPGGVMVQTSPIVEAVETKFVSLDVQQAHLDAILSAMYDVVNTVHGTAYSARIKEPGMEMAGKTGTAQVHRYTEAEREHGHLTGASIPWKERDDALFIGFAPASAPRYVCAVVVEHGGTTGGEGGAVAAPIAHDVLLEAQKRDPVRRVPAQPFGAPTTVAQD